MDWRARFAGLPARATLRNATVPVCLTQGCDLIADPDGLALADIILADGRIEALRPAGSNGSEDDGAAVNLDRGMVWPCFVDCHTHLDKGHIWARAANPDGTFKGAIATVMADRGSNWSRADVEARMEFALKCAYAHGTSAIRTHLDSRDRQTAITWPVYGEIKDRWQDRIELDASPLFPIDLALDDAHLAEVTRFVARHGRTLGAVTYMTAGLERGVDRLFRLASEQGWNLDFHVDESLEPADNSLDVIADAALRYRFAGQVIVGHCCSLSVQPAGVVSRTIDKLARAGIAVVSLPMCNSYLQDRNVGITPRQRGVTLLHELRTAGVAVAIASDNTRDPFFAYGDLDGLEVFREAVRIAHLDHPVGNWPQAITTAPAALLGLSDHGRLRAGTTADLIAFAARTWTELLSRPQSNRAVLRAGRLIPAELPDYRELDPLFG